MTTRRFTIGPGPNLPRTALDTILKDVEQSNANDFKLEDHRFDGEEVVLTYRFTTLAPTEEAEEEREEE